MKQKHSFAFKMEFWKIFILIQVFHRNFLFSVIPFLVVFFSMSRIIKSMISAMPVRDNAVMVLVTYLFTNKISYKNFNFCKKF